MNQSLIELIQSALSKVSDPELHRSITELGMVQTVSVNGSDAAVHILLTISGCPMRDRLDRDIRAAVLSVDGIKNVDIEFGAMNEEQRNNVKKLMRGGRDKTIQFADPSSLTRVIGIASGKGGVGKSSVTANLAVAAARKGYKV